MCLAYLSKNSSGEWSKTDRDESVVHKNGEHDNENNDLYLLILYFFSLSKLKSNLKQVQYWQTSESKNWSFENNSPSFSQKTVYNPQTHPQELVVPKHTSKGWKFPKMRTKISNLATLMVHPLLKFSTIYIQLVRIVFFSFFNIII